MGKKMVTNGIKFGKPTRTEKKNEANHFWKKKLITTRVQCNQHRTPEPIGTLEKNQQQKKREKKSEGDTRSKTQRSIGSENRKKIWKKKFDNGADRTTHQPRHQRSSTPDEKASSQNKSAAIHQWAAGSVAAAVTAALIFDRRRRYHAIISTCPRRVKPK